MQVNNKWTIIRMFDFNCDEIIITKNHQEIFLIRFSTSTPRTYQKFSPIKFSTELAAAIRIPLSFKIVALSMPRSSDRSMSKKSPTECVIGLSVNWHNSFRLGSGTVTCGRPYTYLTVTVMKWKGEQEKWFRIVFCIL